MDFSTFQRESALNRSAYARLRPHIQSALAGQYVALAQGKLIGSAATFDEARALIGQLRPMPEYYLVFPASVEPDFDLVLDLTGQA